MQERPIRWHEIFKAIYNYVACALEAEHMLIIISEEEAAGSVQINFDSPVAASLAGEA